MESTAPPTQAAWRPNFLWLPMGLILGAASGAAVGAVLPLLLFGPQPAIALVALVYGGIFGGIVGLPVGLLMSFAVGSHLPVQQARERAFLVSFVGTGPPIAVLASATIGLPLACLAGLLSALASGLLSYRVAALDNQPSPATG